jgi:AcrR family transcriptional regulator
MNQATPSTPGMRTLQRQATKRELVRGALRIVAEKGFSNTTTASVARETGKAHGTVFVHFPTRDALVAEMVNEIGSIISARLAAVPSEAVGLSSVLDAHLAALADQEVYLCRLLQETIALPPSARALLFALQSGVAAKIRAGLARDVAEGVARSFDPVALSNIWIALTNHYLINRDLFAPEESVIARHGKALKSQLLSIVSMENIHD